MPHPQAELQKARREIAEKQRVCGDEHGPLSRAELIELVRLTSSVYLKRCSVLGESHPRTLKAEESLERYELALQVAPIDHSVLGQSVVGDESSPRAPARTGGFF